MAEEQRLQSPENHRLCRNNCGFSGNPATLNLCSKCYIAFRLNEEQRAAAPTKSPPPCSASSSLTTAPESPGSAQADTMGAVGQAGAEAARAKRCASCRKRIGFMGFRCRCGSVYCGSHRYPEEHGCGFDYKRAGKEAIAMANPLVRASKLEKI